MYDIAIIGGGPGGATLARLIGEKYKVLLVDKRPFLDQPKNSFPGKCCGGLLAPDAQRLLSKLGLGLPRDILEDPQLFVVKAIDLERGLERYYQRHYINMDRERFDHWLLSLIPRQVDIRPGSRLKSYQSEGNSFRLNLVQDNRNYIEQSKILVGG